MQIEILKNILELREIETSKALEMSIERALQMIKSYIGYDAPKEVFYIAIDLALLIFDNNGYTSTFDGVKSIKEGEVSVTYSGDYFNSEMKHIFKELDIFRCASW